MKNTIINAKITSTRWDRERGLTHWISVEGDGWGCSFGGYHLKDAACYEWVMALMDALDLYEFDEKKLIGQIVRVELEGDGCAGFQILAIGHPIKDKWLRPKEIFAKYSK